MSDDRRSRNLVIKILDDTYDFISSRAVSEYTLGQLDALEETRKAIREIPPHAGRWKKLTAVPQTSSLYMAECSVCGKSTYMGEHCMKCGARMEAEA